MHEDAMREEEELLEKILAAVKENGSCARFARVPGGGGLSGSRLFPTTDEIESSNELTIGFPIYGIPGNGNALGTPGRGLVFF